LIIENLDKLYCLLYEISCLWLEK